MGNIRQYDTGALGLNPTETGVQAVAATARRVGAFSNQVAGATETLARETEQLGRATKALGHETGALGDFQAHLTAQTGARLGSAVQFASNEAINYVAHREISQGAAEFAQLNSDLTDKWNKTAKTADPNDPSVAGKFHEEVLNPSLEKFKEAFVTERGQQWAEGHTASLRNHMFERTSADMATLAGDAVHVNTRRMANAWSNTARNDPSSVPYLLSTADSSIGGVVDTSPNLKGAAAAKVRTLVSQKAKEEIVRAGALGAIEKSADPERAAASFAERYPEYVDSKEISQFAQAAKSIKRLNESEARSARVMRDYEVKNDFHQKVNELEVSTMPQNVGDPPQLPPDYWSKLRELSTHPGAALEPGRLKTMVQNGETITTRLNKPEPASAVSRATYMTLSKQIAGVDGPRMNDENDIWKQSENLSVPDLNRLRAEFRDMRSPEGERLAQAKGELVKAVKPGIDKSNPLMGKMDHDGALNLYRFDWDLSQRIAEYRKAGKNPYDLFDPSKPDYFGKPETLGQYQKPLQESIADQTRRLTGRPAPSGTPASEKPITQVVPRNPGETADAYLRRIGAK